MSYFDATFSIISDVAIVVTIGESIPFLIICSATRVPDLSPQKTMPFSSQNILRSPSPS